MEEKEQSSEPPPCVMTSLPEDVILDILARVPRCNYPTLSLVSKHFRSLVAASEIYARRSLLGCTEHSLYVILSNRRGCYDGQLYILSREANGNQGLFLIPSLHSMPQFGSYVAMGSKIYVFNTVTTSPSGLIIDCISHTAQRLPVPVPMIIKVTITVADITDGRIYVIGYYWDFIYKKVMVVFNTETQTWEPETIKMDTEVDVRACECVVMAGKIYFRDRKKNSIVYEPKGSKWETDEMVNAKEWVDACVVDNVLYYYDNVENKLRAYDSEKKCWGVVNGGVEELLAKKKVYGWWKTVSYSGKLFLFNRQGNLVGVTYFAEISLQRNQQREIWGKVEWCDGVEIAESVYILKSLGVMV
ncbi:unnamed protein product [Microthlaspi erraticum]|uniref:F-box domain-containing protein n=1 Tax=Microthlaspi erraticum TaxID=1685480 RepID=A0A6D2I742_9BRAS|nr:unnamed protein product [Microthlaspi erraticum]